MDLYPKYKHIPRECKWKICYIHCHFSPANAVICYYQNSLTLLETYFGKSRNNYTSEVYIWSVSLFLYKNRIALTYVNEQTLLLIVILKENWNPLSLLPFFQSFHFFFLWKLKTSAHNMYSVLSTEEIVWIWAYE